MIDPELTLAAGVQPQFDYADPTAARARIARMGATLVDKKYWKDSKRLSPTTSAAFPGLQAVRPSRSASTHPMKPCRDAGRPCSFMAVVSWWAT